jgi:hypothetical protein
MQQVHPGGESLRSQRVLPTINSVAWLGAELKVGEHSRSRSAMVASRHAMLRGPPSRPDRSCMLYLRIFKTGIFDRPTGNPSLSCFRGLNRKWTRHFLQYSSTKFSTHAARIARTHQQLVNKKQQLRRCCAPSPLPSYVHPFICGTPTFLCGFVSTCLLVFIPLPPPCV